MSTQSPPKLELIAAIADGLPVGIFVASAPAGDFVYANRAFDRILGMPPTDRANAGSFSPSYGIYTHAGTLYPEDQLPFVRALREKTTVTIDDLVIHRGDGKKAYVRAFARPLVDAEGVVTHVVIAFIDISEEILARSRADLVEGRLQHLLSRAPLILFAFDRHGIVTLSEGRGLEAIGFRPKQLLGQSVFDLYATDAASLANARRALAGEEFVVTYHLGPVVLETSFTPTRDAAGEVDGAIGVCVDATDRASMHVKLLQAERLASMGTLSAAVAHEINNPLTYLLGNLDLLAKRIAEPGSLPQEDLLPCVDRALEGADRVRRIVRGLRTFSRQDDDRAEPTDVHAAIEAALGMADNVLRHRARLVRRLDRVPPVLANDLRLTQVFVNLLLNAAQAIPEGRAEANEIRVLSWHDERKGVVTVAIEDTGVGIAPDTKTRLFEPFFTTKPVGEGTGLGLSICYGILKGFGGSIEVDSAVGKGATVRVSLVACGRARDGRSVAPAAAPLRRGRLLVVDDDEKVARMLALLLGEAHDVEVNTDPRAAVERVLGGERFDVIFCDLMMPQMTGMDFHAVLTKRVPEQAERIVFVTGGAFTPAARAFTASVSNTFLDKPFDDNALHAVLASYLRR